MLKSHERFHSANGKRLILIVDDEAVNRELLKLMLSEDYEILCAENGQEALQLIRDRAQVLSLVLLDLIMPGMHGLDVLRQMKEDGTLNNLPVIVMTSEKHAEVESLRLGAMDFILKPFDMPEVVQARIRRIIELSEDRMIIRSTERDALTGLYSREYFYRYAEQFDQFHKDLATDAIVIDINHFHMINERYGKARGDEILKTISRQLLTIVQNNGGMVCRRSADTFLIYCPHVKDYKAILNQASAGLSGPDSDSGRVRLRMGVYQMVDKSIDIERRFDRAKLAADRVRGAYAASIEFYDNELHEKQLFAERLLENVESAFREHQFKVFYQPKFNIRGETPRLASAEALVRWMHPELGTISPGIFIPLFEKNGLIQRLDEYVWQEAAAQVNRWKEAFDVTLPVSVNVSRIDLYDPNLVGKFRSLMLDNSLDPADYLLEITESAYTENSDQIIRTVTDLRSLGFRVEMDDFGTGYSSLNMLTSLPIDALKLDMKFVRNILQDKRNLRMLELMIDIAEYMHVPVIAEGVETEDQMLFLKGMGCHMVQGYYFSKPLPPEQFEHFVISLAEQRRREPGREDADRLLVSYSSIARALSSGFEQIYYVDLDTDAYMAFSSRGGAETPVLEKNGLHFFENLKQRLGPSLDPKDIAKAKSGLDKNALIRAIRLNGSYSLTYRKLVDGQPVYHQLRAVRITGSEQHHIVIGISNVDAQIKRDQEFARTQDTANRDTLTGVKNLNAFAQAEEKLDTAISDGTQAPFSIAVCAVCGLDSVIQDKGLEEGDARLCAASLQICNIFKHSPVFRVGRDVFAALLTGQDYARRQALFETLDQLLEKRRAADPVCIAGGSSDYVPGRDKNASAVLKRAEAQLEEKMQKHSLHGGCHVPDSGQ